jgi:hypothetical protein
MNRTIHVHRQIGDHIEHPSAYEAAIKARIKANASKTRRAKWFAAHPDAERLNAWLNQYGEFKNRYSCGNVWTTGGCCDNSDRCLNIGEKAHPLVEGMFAGDFGKVLLQMRDAISEWGGLTDKQTDLVRRALARAEERLQKAQQRREERLAGDRATSRHVGTVGERIELTLRCEKVFEFESVYGMTFINICKDADGNVVVYKGSNGFEEGETLRLKATIKSHGERDGVAQTLISRPKTI